MADFLLIIRGFLESGGNVLLMILVVTIGLWSLIAERFIYLRFSVELLELEAIEAWQQYKDLDPWMARAIRQMIVSQVSQRLNASIPLIRTLVIICPMLGLLGTVTGMISVFDSLAVTGTGNVRLMASGISMATIPTMAGMVAALSGLYFGSVLQKMASRETEKIKSELVL